MKHLLWRKTHKNSRDYDWTKKKWFWGKYLGRTYMNCGKHYRVKEQI